MLQFYEIHLLDFTRLHKAFFFEPALSPRLKSILKPSRQPNGSLRRHGKGGTFLMITYCGCLCPKLEESLAQAGNLVRLFSVDLFIG